MRWYGMVPGCLCKNGTFDKMELPKDYEKWDINTYVRDCRNILNGCEFIHAAPPVWQTWHKKGRLCGKTGGERLYEVPLVGPGDSCPSGTQQCVQSPKNVTLCVENFPDDCPIIDIVIERRDFNGIGGDEDTIKKPGYEVFRRFPEDGFDLHYSKTNSESHKDNALPPTSFTYEFRESTVSSLWPCTDPQA